jgi:hypothetical protein
MTLLEQPRDALVYAAAELHLAPELGLLHFLPETLQVRSNLFEDWGMHAATRCHVLRTAIDGADITASFMSTIISLQTALQARLGFVLEVCLSSRFAFLTSWVMKSDLELTQKRCPEIS